jgi:hypothetical protein
MAVRFVGEDEESQGTWQPWARQEGVSLLIRIIPPGVYDRLEAQVDRGLKAREFIQQPMPKARRRGVELSRAAAAYALLDTRGFEFVTGSVQVAEALSKALGSEVKLEEAVSLDGKWSPAVKDAVFRAYPRFAGDIDTAADEMAEAAVEVEKARGKT